MILIGIWILISTVAVLFFAFRRFNMNDHSVDSAQSAVVIHRQHIDELTRQFNQGELSQAEYDPRLREAQKALLEDSEPKQRPLKSSAFSWYVWPLMSSVCVAVTFFVYDQLGAQSALQVKQQFDQIANADAADFDLQKLKSSLAAFQALLDDQPENIEGWYQLSQMQLDLMEYQEAVSSLQHVLSLLRSNAQNAEDEARVLANLGESYLALNSFEQALDVLQQSLALSPNPIVLGLAGQAAFEVSDYIQAIEYWERLKLQYDSSDVSIIDRLIVRAKEALKQQGGSYEHWVQSTLRVEIQLPNAWQGLPESARLFVYARPKGERMPLLAKRLTINQQTMQVSLSQSDAIRSVDLNDFDTLELSAKISLKGTADPDRGDWIAQPTTVSLGERSRKSTAILRLSQPSLSD